MYINNNNLVIMQILTLTSCTTISLKYYSNIFERISFPSKMCKATNLNETAVPLEIYKILCVFQYFLTSVRNDPAFLVVKYSPACKQYRQPHHWEPSCDL